MKNTLKSKMLTILALVLSVCMLFGTAGIISTMQAKAESTTEIASLVPGASVRVTDAEKSGIKFRARLNKNDYNTLYNTYDGVNGKVNAGMIIVPSDYIAKADGYSLTKFAAANLKVGKSNIEEFKEVTDGGVDYLEFTMSLVNLYDANYARDFEAIPYIEIASDSAVTGFELYEGKYYAYGERVASNARNIYQVANATFNDRVASQDEDHPYLVNNKYMSVDENGLTIVKGYVDGVADIKIANNVPTIANNTTYYTSPYSFTNNAITGDYILDGAPKSLVVDGERQVDMHVEKGSVEIHTTKTLSTTVENGVITTTGREMGVAGQPFVFIPGAVNSSGVTRGFDTSYYAFEGKYGVGTAIDIYFTGNNMPEVMFFADTVDGNMTGYSTWNGADGNYGVPSGAKGVLITNGFYNSGSNSADGYFNIWGPNRMFMGESTNITGALSAMVNGTTYALAYGTSGGTMKHFVQSYIQSTYADVNFKYTITTYETTDSKLGIKGELYNVDTEALVHSYSYSFDILSEINPGSIVLYDTVKGAGDNTVFTCSTPYGGDIVSNGSVTPDGTVTLTTAQAASAGGTSGISNLNNAYIAFEGEYGIGTFVDVEFSGHNMPQIMFFADAINGNMSSNGGTGLIVMNGLNAGSVAGADEINFFGPNRFNAGGNFITLTDQTNGSYELTTSSAFTYNALSTDTTGKTYIYKVGTMLDETDNTIILHAEFTDKESGMLLEIATVDTGIASSTVTAGSIVAYAPVKGAGTATFKIGKPYAGTASYQMSGATIANDGTVTLATSKTGGLGASGQLFDLIEGYSGYSKLSYFGLAGEYGVGTYMDFYFTGNNMPEVMFFADVINERMTGYTSYSSSYATSTGEKGVLISNGFYCSGYEARGAHEYFAIWGPNRLSYGTGANVNVAGIFVDNVASKAQYYAKDGSLLTQKVLGSGSYDTTNFKYTVGTYEAGENLGVHVILYTVSGETLTKVIEDTIDTGIALTEIEAGNIILFETLNGTNTTFKYAAPYESAPSVFSKGATVAEDGTITLTGTNFGAYNYMYGLATVDNNYYALNGKYGVGTYVDVYFTGNNMPEIMLFADVINGNMTGYDDYTYVAGSGDWTNYTLNNNKGLLFSNGFMSGAGAQQAPDFFVIWGMDRATIAADKIGAAYRDATAYALKRYIATTAEALALSQNALATTYPETALKYTVGTYDDNGKLAIEVILTDVATGNAIIEIEFTSNVLTADVEPGSIIFYDTIKGAGNNTVFKIGNVYE